MCAVIYTQIDVCDVTGMNSGSFVSVTSRKPVVPKLLINKGPENREAVQGLDKVQAIGLALPYNRVENP